MRVAPDDGPEWSEAVPIEPDPDRDPTPVHGVGAAPRSRKTAIRRAASTSGPYALVGAAALAVVGIIYQPWSGRWRIPWSYGLDNVGYAIFVRNLQLHGSYHFTDSLGAPWTQELYDFPQGGSRINLIAWRLLGLVIDDPFAVLNVHFVIASAAIAMVAFGVLKRFGLGAPMAAALALVYTFLPYRFWHGLQHVTLSAYFTVPLAALLALWLADGRFNEARRAWRGGDRRQALRLVAAPIAVIAVAASADPYYTIFTIILVLIAGSSEAIRRRSWSTLVPGVVVAVALGGVLALNLMPEALYRHENGANERVTERTAAESEGYALHLTQMVLPDPNHRVSRLAAYGAAAREVPAPGEGGTSLGLLAVAGVLISVGSVLGLAAVRRARWVRIRQLGVWQLGLVIVATVGGAGFTLAIFGFTQIRGWGRLVIFIGFLAIAAVGLALTALAQRLADRRSVCRSVVTAAMAVVVGLLGLLDAIPADERPIYAARQGVARQRSGVRRRDGGEPARSGDGVPAARRAVPRDTAGRHGQLRPRPALPPRPRQAAVELRRDEGTDRRLAGGVERADRHAPVCRGDRRGRVRRALHRHLRLRRSRRRARRHPVVFPRTARRHQR